MTDPSATPVRMVTLSTVVELVGVLCLLVAAFAVDWRLGVALVGVLLLAAGFLLDVSDRAEASAGGGDL